MIPLIDITKLRLKLPPPLITLLCVVLGSLVSKTLPQLAVAFTGSVMVSGFLIFAGLMTAALGVVSVRRAGTTIDPTKPNTSSSLVTTGIYRITRNPMYLGLAILLLGWAAFLSNIAALLALPLFVAYITYFQIIPEEQALTQRFPEQYQMYRRSVRRWL